MKQRLATKLYYSISEVAEITDLQAYTLRAWEKEFSCLRPRRIRNKNRAYRQRDIGIIFLVKRLLYQERFTTQGVRQKLKSEPELLQQASADTSWLTGQGQGEKTAEAAKPAAKAQTEAAPKAPPELKKWVASLRRDLKEIRDLLP